MIQDKRIGRRLVQGKVRRKIDSGNVIGVSDRRKVLVKSRKVLVEKGISHRRIGVSKKEEVKVDVPQVEKRD